MRQREQHAEIEPALTACETALTINVDESELLSLVAAGELVAPVVLHGGYRWLARDVPSEPWLVKRVERIAAHRARRGRRQADWATPDEDEAGR